MSYAVFENKYHLMAQKTIDGIPDKAREKFFPEVHQM